MMPTRIKRKQRLPILEAAGDDAKNQDGDKDDDNNNDDDDKMVSDFFFDLEKANIDARSSMDAGIYEMLEGKSGSNNDGTPSGNSATEKESSTESSNQETAYENTSTRDQERVSSSKSSSNEENESGGPTASLTSQANSNSKVVVMDWECLLDALPYHIELGIYAARTVWPHLNDLCNFDTDRAWLENKLAAMSHVLGHDPSDRHRHFGVEYALATRLILEEQALDRNESTGKQGRYARRFHPRAEINGHNEFGDERAPSRRPLTAGELAVNWREFIRSTLLVKYALPTTEAASASSGNPVDALEDAIEAYLKPARGTRRSSTDLLSSTKTLPLFPQTKFALRNSSTKLVVRISHRFDNDLVARSLNSQLRLLPHERLPRTYQPERAVQQLFDNSNNNNNPQNTVLLLRPDSSQESTQPKSSDRILGTDRTASEEDCLRDIMNFTHRWGWGNDQSPGDSETATGAATAPSVVWVDSSWHRLQSLAPVFGDTIPGVGTNGSRKNTAACPLPPPEEDAHASDEKDDDDPPEMVWLSLWLAEWPTRDTQLMSSSSLPSQETAPHPQRLSLENHEAAMVYPWTDSLSWQDAEDLLIPATWGSSDTSFQ